MQHWTPLGLRQRGAPWDGRLRPLLLGEIFASLRSSLEVAADAASVGCRLARESFLDDRLVVGWNLPELLSAQALQ